MLTRNINNNYCIATKLRTLSGFYIFHPLLPITCEIGAYYYFSHVIDRTQKTGRNLVTSQQTQQNVEPEAKTRLCGTIINESTLQTVSFGGDSSGGGDVDGTIYKIVLLVAQHVYGQFLLKVISNFHRNP